MSASLLPLNPDVVRSSSQTATAVCDAPFWPERAAAAVALAAAAPALGVVLFTVRVLSRQAPLIAHRRVGQLGKTFWVIKVRTMWEGSTPLRGAGWLEHLGGSHVPEVKGGRDSRVTSGFARWCRRHSIDELPQLLQVVTGEMRLVGPRPMTPEELCKHYMGAKEELLSVLPGLTGLWQVMGRDRLTYAQRRRLDLFFVRHRCWRLYFGILLRTVGEVLRGRNAS